MKSIQELREKLQKEKIEGRERPWGYRLFQRGPSIFITRLFISTSIKPNTITVLSVLFGLAGCIALLSLSWELKIAGLALLYIHLILDRVDGEVARYKNIYSLRGIYLDEINHYLIPPVFFICTAWGLSPLAPIESSFVILAGAAAAVSSILLRVSHNLHYGIYLKKYVKHSSILTIPKHSTNISEIRTQHFLVYPVLKVLHQFQDFLITLILFALVLLLEQIYTPYLFIYSYSTYLLLAYAFLLWLIVLENIIKGTMRIESYMKELSLMRPQVNEGPSEQ